MKAIAACLLASTLVSLPVARATASDKVLQPQRNHSASALADAIDMAEWSLRHLSVSKAIPFSVLDVSLSTLYRARQELAAGNLPTARDTLQRATQPLGNKSESSMVWRIAFENNVSDDFNSDARETEPQNNVMLATGLEQAVDQTSPQAYGIASRYMAEPHSGAAIYVPTTTKLTYADWRDGLRSIDEQRRATCTLFEARSDGLDITLLEQEVMTAEARVGSATACAEYEKSWRAVGVTLQ